MLNGNVRPVPSQDAGSFVPNKNRPYSWTSSTSTISSNSIFNKSEPVFRLNDDLSTPVFTSNSSLQLSWRNPRNEMSVTSPVEYRSSSSTMSDHETWDEEESTDGSRIYPVRSGDMATTSFGTRDPYSVSSEELMDTVFDSRSPRTLSKTKTGSADTSWLEDKLAKDLSSIMPTFEFSKTSFKRLSDRPMFSSSSDSASEASSDESQSMTYCASPELEPRVPRHSWASNLDIIDSDHETLERFKGNANSKRPKRDRSRSRRNSYDNSFRYRKPSSERGTLKRNQNQNEMQDNKLTYLRFESQTKFNYNERGIPALKRLIKSKSNSSELIIEGDRLVVKFKRRKDLLCSSVKTRKRKVVLHLLDVVNVLVFTGSNTLIIQFKESTKTKLLKEKSTLDKLSDTIRSSKSNSLSRSMRSAYSDGDSEISELEVGRFHNSKELADLILKQRQSLVPKGILKRGGSLAARPVEPIMIKPAKMGISPSPAEEIMECLTYV
ncbi:uncharacterized protein LOC134817946 [Bolinopsis microptera]|uniref:uncharacterized protein LOC134817946 n=1 Tax=Bolinopsis microptera TaxID=2820187 RepID=UPI003079F34D